MQMHDRFPRLAAASALAALPLLFATPALGSQEQGADAAPELVAEDRQYVHEPVAWLVGEVDADALKRRAAGLELRRRSLGGAAGTNAELLEQLVDLRRRASTPQPFAGQSRVLREATFTHAQALIDAGKLQAALAVLREPSPRPTAQALESGAATKAVSPAFAGLYLETASNPKLLQHRHELVQRLAVAAPAAQETPAPVQDFLAETIEQAIAGSDWQTLRAIGGRAIPALSAAVLATNVAELPRWDRDPIFGLYQLAPARAAEVVLDLAEEVDDAYVLRVRVLRILTEVDMFDHRTGSSVWRPTSEETFEQTGRIYDCALPGWLDVLAWILEEPGLVARALPLAGLPLRFDAMTPRLARAVAALVAAIPAQERPSPLDGIESSRPTLETTQPVYEALLANGTPAERRVAAELLQWTPRSPTLMAQADSPDPKIREYVAASRSDRGQRKVRMHEVNGLKNYTSIVFQNRIEDQDRAILEGLADDPVAAVRRKARESLLGQGWLTLERARGALERDGLRAAQELLAEWSLPSSMLAELLVEVSRFAEGNPAARHAVEDSYLKRLVDSLASEDLERPLAGYFAWAPYDELSRAILEWLLEDATRAGQAARALGTVADDERRAVLAGRVAPLLFMSQGSLDPSQRLVATRALTEHAPTVVRAALVHGMAQDTKVPDRLLLITPDQRRALESVLRGVAADADVEPAVRAASLHSLEAAPAELVHAMLADLDPQAEQPTQGLSLLRHLLDLLEPRERREWVRDLLARTEPSSAFLARAVGSYVWHGDLMEAAGDFELALVDWVLARPATIDRLASVLSDALVPLLATIPGGTAPERIAGLLKLDDSDTFEATCRVVREARDPAHLPALEAVLSSGLWIRWHPYGVDVPAGVAAADTVTSYLTDEAAAVLLRGLSSPIQRVREECGRGLEEIQRVRRLRAAFEDEDARVPTREQAVAELFALLAEEDVTLRAAAAEGLATLGVLEAVPRLVRLLKDPDPAVSGSARKALATLRERAPALVAPPDEPDAGGAADEGDG